MTLWAALPDDIRSAEQARQRAMCAADVDALSAVLHADLIYIHSNGMRDGKASHLAAIGAGIVRYVTLDLQAPTCIRLPPAALILSGRLQASATVAGQPVPIDAAFTAVWRCEDVWRLVAWQSTPWPRETMANSQT